MGRFDIVRAPAQAEEAIPLRTQRLKCDDTLGLHAWDVVMRF